MAINIVQGEGDTTIWVHVIGMKRLSVPPGGLHAIEFSVFLFTPLKYSCLLTFYLLCGPMRFDGVDFSLAH